MHEMVTESNLHTASVYIAIKLLIILKRYLLRKIHSRLTCHWVAVCCSCHCTVRLKDSYSTLSPCESVLRLLHEHHLLTGYALTTIKSQIMRL